VTYDVCSDAKPVEVSSDDDHDKKIELQWQYVGRRRSSYQAKSGWRVGKQIELSWLYVVLHRFIL